MKNSLFILTLIYHKKNNQTQDLVLTIQKIPETKFYDKRLDFTYVDGNLDFENLNKWYLYVLFSDSA